MKPLKISYTKQLRGWSKKLTPVSEETGSQWKSVLIKAHINLVNIENIGNLAA